MVKPPRRDLIVALVATCTTLAVVALAQPQTSLMGSSVFDWANIEARPTKTGAVRQFFDARTEALDKFECHVTTLNASEAPHAPHKHVDEELIIVKEGTVEALVNGDVRRVGAGSVLFFATNQEHGVRNVGPTQATYYVVRWSSPGMLKNKVSQRSIPLSFSGQRESPPREAVASLVRCPLSVVRCWYLSAVFSSFTTDHGPRTTDHGPRTTDER